MPEDGGRSAIEHTLHAHTRAITDINFSAHHPDILSTCAVDGYVHCWDLRRPRRPVMTFVDWDAGATQVKWNRQDGHILASSHDRWLRIWDDRKGAYPLRSIEAHSSKIYGVDWNRTRATGVVTCSLDRSIKFWDYGNDEDVPERVIRTDFPVWRARHTPFGWGLLAMPQDVPGKLHLYDRRKDEATTESSPSEIAVFPGHGDKKVKEFLWRSRGEITAEGADNREFQLVSWGEDHELRLQRLDLQTLEAVGYVRGSQLREKLNVTRKGAVYKSFRNVERSETEKTKASIKGPRHSILSDSMNKLSSQFPRNHFGSNGASMRGKPMDPVSRNQIGWMSGIKFSKRTDTEPGSKKIPSERRLSVMSPNFDPEWDTPESLHDEIIRVSEQFTKVSWENIEMDRRRLTVSMNGPWGEGGEPVYINVRIEFPDRYPEAKLPVFNVGKSSLIPQQTYAKIIRELQQIAAGFVGRKRGCLEATVCYLLGEVDLQESTLWFSETPDVDELECLANGSSSEDDDSDMPAGSSAMMSQELDPSATEGVLINAIRNANMPPPRSCGAKFASNGKLICFFPPKAEKFKSLLGANAIKERPKGVPFFNTFASLRNDIITRRSKFLSITDDNGEDSDSSQDSQDSSSSESDSSRFRGGVAYGFWRKVQGSNYRNALSTNRSQRSSGAGTGTGTGTGTGGSRGRLPKPKNIISMYDIRGDLPAKQELADEYAIFGNGADVCNHNSQVASKYGYQDLADIWQYAGMLLEHEVPLEVLDKSHRSEPILVIAHDMIKRSRRDSGSDSGIDLSNDTQAKGESISGRVKWGYSPLAKPLISDLFKHFERLADVQMLAMLSCVFSEPSTPDGVSRAEMHLSQPHTPLSMKTPGFSLDYFPSDAAAWNNLHKTTFSSSSTPKTALTPVGLYGSVGSSNGGQWGSDPASASYSCGETPPMRSVRDSTERLVQNMQSLSLPPEEARNVRRTNTSLASSFAANVTRSFSATTSSSPPNRKRPSPVESLMNSLAPSAVTWGNNTVFESVRGHAQSGGSSYSDDETVLDNGKISPVVGISITMYNQDAFDDDGCMSVPLLDYRHANLYSAYRQSYAELLAMWGKQLACLEVLKFDALPDYFKERDASLAIARSFTASITSSNEKGSIREFAPSLPILLGKKEYPDPSAQLNARGLDITGYCLKHEYRLEPLPLGSSSEAGGAIGRCERCKMLKTQLRCVICDEPVLAVYAPCLSCGCVSHPQCLNQYHEAGERQCAGGCDCDCPTKAGMGLVESWEAMMGAIEKMRMLHMNQKGRKSEDSDRDETTDWENVKVESRQPPSPGLAMGYTSLSRQLKQVRTSEWGSGLRRKRSLQKKDETV
jgi:WD repeat-containing protein 59